VKLSGADTKKDIILDLARELQSTHFSPAELEQIRRQLVVRLGAAGNSGVDYIAQVLEDAGLRVVRSRVADTQGLHDDEFRDLLHFASLEEAEMCLMRLDELLRNFRADGERAAAERVLDVARLGRRRAEMIARNPRVEAGKREQKREILQWFRIWLETPEAFFDWLYVRKHSADYQCRFGSAEAPSAAAGAEE
jgi:hypothetical protein